MRQVTTIADTQRCPACGVWVPMTTRRRRQTFDRHIRENHPEVYKQQRAYRAELLGDE